MVELFLSEGLLVYSGRHGALEAAESIDQCKIMGCKHMMCIVQGI